MEPLASVEELRTHLQSDIGEEIAALALAGASGFVRDYCRWHVAPVEADVTFTLDGNGRAVLTLPTLRLGAVDEVRVGGVVVTDYTASRRGQLYRSAGWYAGWNGIEVDVAEHGYDSTPEGVRAVVLTLASRAVVNPEGLRSRTVGAVSKSFVYETMRGDLTELQAAQLAAYRLP